MSVDNLMTTSHDLDCIIQGDRFPVVAGPILRARKWKSGTWVRYVTDENNANNWTVERSNGVYAAGFLMYGSEDYSDARRSNYRNYTSFQNAGELSEASGSAVITMITGGGRFLFANYETVALNALGERTGGPITYILGEDLKVSENGLLCNDTDANLLAATGGTQTLVVGVCSKLPVNGGKIGFDLKY